MLLSPRLGFGLVSSEANIELISEIARRGLAILLVEQKLSIALDISKRVYVMGHGRIVFEGTPADLKANQQVRHDWLEV